MDHSDASGSSTLFLYLFFLMKDYGSIVIFPTFIVHFVSLLLSASPFSSKLVFVQNVLLFADHVYYDRKQRCIAANDGHTAEKLFAGP